MRVRSKLDAACLVRLLRKVRSLCKLDHAFAIAMDVSSPESGDESLLLSGEEHFYGCLPPLRGDQVGKFEKFDELAGLPLLLVVVQKGRFGDTFPPTFKAFDVRARYFREQVCVCTGHLKRRARMDLVILLLFVIFLTQAFARLCC